MTNFNFVGHRNAIVYRRLVKYVVVAFGIVSFAESNLSLLMRFVLYRAASKAILRMHTHLTQSAADCRRNKKNINVIVTLIFRGKTGIPMRFPRKCEHIKNCRRVTPASTYTLEKIHKYLFLRSQGRVVRGIFAATKNAAGGAIWTATGGIGQSDVANIVNGALYGIRRSISFQVFPGYLMAQWLPNHRSTNLTSQPSAISRVSM